MRPRLVDPLPGRHWISRPALKTLSAFVCKMWFANANRGFVHRLRHVRNRMPMADRGWKRPFEDPIPLPRGRQLVTLKDAADYITRLPKAEHESRNGRLRSRR